MIATGRITELRKLVAAARDEGSSVGFVPTMGALHEGHRSLISRARAGNGCVVVSIFVNPAQFGPNEDLSAYPRTFADDLEACKTEGADLVFHPDADEMYPDVPLTRVEVGGVTETMEGEQRPGHFAGVALVCAKLFAIVGPCTAYFGEKDAQQLRVVRRMASDLSIPVEIVACPTVREPDGLAMSSRNTYLTSGERARARGIPEALHGIEDLFAAGTTDARCLESSGRAVLERAGVDAVDYLEVVDSSTLARLDRARAGALVCVAVRIGRTRLIDNVTLKDGTGER